MSNKLRRKRIEKGELKKSVISEVKKSKSLVQSNPKLTAIVSIVIYFLLGYLMLDTAKEMNTALIVIFTLLAPSTLYSYYVYDYQRGLNPIGGTDTPRFISNKKKYTLVGWLFITAYGVLLLISEPFVVTRFFPVLDNNYYQSQIMMMLFIAPIMEEIIFRYLLYDRWLRRKWGWFWGFMTASLIFVICHPVTDFRSFVIYLAPTVLFFLIYHEFGLYGAITIHMIYNMIAI